MAEKIIIDIEMSSEDVRLAEQRIATARKQVEELRDANKALDKSSAAYTKNAVEIKKLNSQISQNERILVANSKAREANYNTVEQLREQLKFVSVQWAREAKAMGENSEKAKQLASQKTILTNQLKKLEKQTGDTRRNVGNYSEGMREALVSSTKAGQGMNNLFNIMKANPILLVVTLIVRLIDQVSKAQFIMDALNKVIEPMNAMFQRMVGLIQELIEGGFSKLGEILRDPIGALKNLGTEMKAAAASGRRLADLTVQIEEAQNALILTEGKLRREIEEQRFAVEDLSKSTEERKAAAEGAIKAVQDLEAARLSVLNKEIEQAQIRASLNDTDRAAQKELNELIAQRDELAAQSIAQQKEIRNQLNNVNKQIQTDADNAKQAELERFKEIEAQKTAAMEEAAQRRAEVAAREVQRNTDIYILGLKNQLIREEITRDEYEQRLRDRELQLLQWQRAGRIALGQDTIDLDNKIADIQLQNIKKVQDATEKGAQANISMKQSELDVAAGVGGALVDITKKTAGENAGITKVAAIASVGINIAQSITKALAEGGPILGPILGAISSALGAVQLAKIKSTNTNFADGVIGLQGPGTETSDSISANLSRGESVMTAKATKVYAPVLAQMERNVGNRPNYQLGARRFANGIIAAGNLPPVNAGREAVSVARDFERALEKMKVWVSLTELNDKQAEFTSARNFASITE